ncbi:LytR C-terminal domain-containing protein [Rhodoferax sp.]|uniref:LytR C-terminal domain-containing protein n=1 Tax=Rhodoferax sp. TaxID=50421 RepID=UPI002733DF87|nr:LytR C-terminal domain-containing protein [Rhodoferax sp.]MDP3192131.1 tetratricopeptide repeat protein [Rhodoferax sp.]MDP3335516.1 tetratricopeptide repeat protein [Rhodoferax sp.]
MKFKLNALASVVMLGTLLGCAPLKPGAPLAGSAATPARGQASTVPVKVAQASAVTAQTPSSDAFYTLGLSAHGAGQTALAGQYYVRALELAPEHAGALNGLAVVYAQSERTDEALKLFARASALAPGAAHVHNNAGYALLRANRLDEAEVALGKARDLDPANAQTQQNLTLLASAKARQAPAVAALSSETGDPNGPRLVRVAPNVFELQAPTHAAAQASEPARETTAPSAQVSAPGATLSGVRLEVSNGVGIRRLARRTADRLASEGVTTARLTNARPYRQLKTEIQYVNGQALAAQALQSRMPVATQAVAAKRLNAGVQLRLVLGHDMAGQAIAAWLDAEEKQQLAVSAPGGWRWS